jgi:hypothetical protein
MAQMISPSKRTQFCTSLRFKELLVPLLAMVVSLLFASGMGGFLPAMPELLLHTSGIIPDVVPDVADGYEDLPVYFDSTFVFNGEHLNIHQTLREPHIPVQSIGHGFSGEYALVLVDPDAPSPSDKSFSQVIHWIVTNIPYNVPSDQEVHKVGTVIEPYLPPSPIAGTHRYTFLLFEQPISHFHPPAPDSRILFNVTSWAKIHNLGKPVAGVFFQSTAGKYLDNYLDTL